MTNSLTEQRIRVIDSHTGGEPTRVVIVGAPDLGDGPLSVRRMVLRDQFDWFRSAVVNEPRGSDVIVGALLTAPHDRTCTAGVIFFNNASVLHMCGHGTIGLAVTLVRMGRIGVGKHRVDTPVGVVGFEYHDEGHVTIENVSSFRYRTIDDLDVPGVGRICGDVAWGGNWFFLASAGTHDLSINNIAALTDYSWKIRHELERRGITGEGGALIDHIELVGPAKNADNHGRNFVLCPGGAYDRSPCGTGTSAKLACLFAEGKLKPGDVWRQESVVGSVFEGSIRIDNGKVIPRIRGTAFITAEADLILDPADPFRTGLVT